MPGEGSDKRQGPLTHEGAEPDRDHETHGIADERATVLQPDGEKVSDTADRVESERPRKGS
jgi:hypothetical protein